MQETQQALLPVIPQQYRQSANLLSPFTWTNITLPVATSQIRSKIGVKPVTAIKSLKKNAQEPISTSKDTSPKNEKQKQKLKQKLLPKKLKEQRWDMLIAHKSIFSQQVTDKPNKMTAFRGRVRSRIQALNKTIQIDQRVSEQQKSKSIHQSYGEPANKIKFLDQKSNMQRYLKSNMAKVGWSGDKQVPYNQAKLLWSNADKNYQLLGLKPGQFYNHLKGSHHLTSKDKLHQIMSIYGPQFYPKSYLVPSQYDIFLVQNKNIILRVMLRQIANQITSFMKNGLILQQITLNQILSQAYMQKENAHGKIILRMCMYLQQIRKNQGWRHFQDFQGYKDIHLSPNQQFYKQILVHAHTYYSGYCLPIDFQRVDYRLLVLVMQYHKLFQSKQRGYLHQKHLWIVKPIASSKGAGITIHRCQQFCRIEPDAVIIQYKNRKKYENKIMQQYLSQPYLLSRPEGYAGRKFDIRQWVLVVGTNKGPIIHKYHTAYCRFAQKTYRLNKLSSNIHLTNYSINKQSQLSLLMLQEIFGFAKDDLRNKYSQQLDEIIKVSVLNCQGIKYRQGCFELFGYDLIFDQKGRLFLLQINLNPACQSERDQGLKREAERMGKSMMDVVMGNDSALWRKVYGKLQKKGQICDPAQIKVKPFYKFDLGQESFINMVRYRQYLVGRMMNISAQYLERKAIEEIKVVAGVVQDDDSAAQEGRKRHIRYIEQHSLTNIDPVQM